MFDKGFSEEIDSVKDPAIYRNNFMKVINCVCLLSECYNPDSDIKNIEHKFLRDFVHKNLNDESTSLEDIYAAINKQKIKQSFLKNNQIKTIVKTIAFVYLNAMKIPDSDKIQVAPISSNFMTNVKNILFSTKPNIHHSHTTGEIIRLRSRLL